MVKALLSPAPQTPLVSRVAGVLRGGVQKGMGGLKGRRVHRSLNRDFEEALCLAGRPFVSPPGQMKKPTSLLRASTGQLQQASGQAANLFHRKGPLATLRNMHLELENKPPTPIMGRAGMRAVCELDVLTFNMGAKLALDSQHTTHAHLSCASSAQIMQLETMHVELVGLSKYNSCHV